MFRIVASILIHSYGWGACGACPRNFIPKDHEDHRFDMIFELPGRLGMVAEFFCSFVIKKGGQNDKKTFNIYPCLYKCPLIPYRRMERNIR